MFKQIGIDTIKQPFIAFENPRIYRIFVYFRFCAIFHDSLWKMRLSTRLHKENVSVLQSIVYLCGTVSFKSYQLFSDSENFYPELRLWPLSAFAMYLGIPFVPWPCPGRESSEQLTVVPCLGTWHIRLPYNSYHLLFIYYFYLLWSNCLFVVVVLMTARGQYDLRIVLGIEHAWVWFWKRSMILIDCHWAKGSKGTLYIAFQA